MFRRFPIVALLGPAALAASSVQGAISYDAHNDRTVSAQMGASSQMFSAPDNAPWTQSASATTGPALATLTSSQTSSLTETGIHATGTLAYTRLMQDLNTGVARGSLFISFTLDQPTDYTLVSSLPGDTASCQLFNAFGTIQSGAFLNVAGTLPAGTYFVSSAISLNAPRTGRGSTSWSVQFTVPAPATGGALAAVGLMLARRCRR